MSQKSFLDSPSIYGKSETQVLEFSDESSLPRLHPGNASLPHPWRGQQETKQDLLAKTAILVAKMTTKYHSL